MYLSDNIFTNKFHKPGQHPKRDAAQPHPNPSMPEAEVFRSGQQPNSESLQLHPS